MVTTSKVIRIDNYKSTPVLNELFKEKGITKAFSVQTIEGTNVYLAFNKILKSINISIDKDAKLIHSFSEPISVIKTSDKGDYVAIGGSRGKVAVFKQQADQSYNALTAYRAHKSTVTGIDFTTNNDRIVSSSLDNTINILWLNKSLNENLTLSEKQIWIRDASFCLNNSCIVSAGDKGTVQLWPGSVQQAFKQMLSNKKYSDIIDQVNPDESITEQYPALKYIWEDSNEYADFKDFWNKMKLKK